jgi:hypothetical protein
MDSQALAVLSDTRRWIDREWSGSLRHALMTTSSLADPPIDQAVFDRVCRYVDDGAATVVVKWYGGDFALMDQKVASPLGEIREKNDAVTAVDAAILFASGSWVSEAERVPSARRIRLWQRLRRRAGRYG